MFKSNPELLASLPENKKSRFNAAYGDAYIASLYCGFKSVPKPMDGEWQHGWIIPERNLHPEFAIGSDGLSTTRKNKTYFVARMDQQNYLNAHGFKHVFAIGLPIIYVDKPKVQRVKNSLLVMPVHSLSDTQENWDDEEYAAYIESKAHHFSEIVLCLHKSCIDKGNWIAAFKKRNIEIVLGADPDDCNTYSRLAFLFSRFEFVTSNDFGSHIAYAAYFEAKPSISGPPPKFKRKDYEKTVFYGNASTVLDMVDNWHKEGFYEKTFPFLYTSPQQANYLKDWAAFQLGLSEKKSPEEFRKLVGWKWSNIMQFNLKIFFRKGMEALKQ